MKKKFIVGIVAPISIVGLTLSLGLGTTAFGTPLDGAQKQSQEDTIIAAKNVTTDIPVAPWCGWYVSGGDNEDISLVPGDGQPTQYTGVEIALTATAALNTAYVGPESGLTAKAGSTDCSWFKDVEKYGARYDVVANGDLFTATALTGGAGTEDSGMNFTADNVNPLNITNDGIEVCAGEGFETNPTAQIKTGTLTTSPWTVLTANVENNNFCQWSAKYDIKIPANMAPLFGNVTYRWTGPTLTHTLVIPETQP